MRPRLLRVALAVGAALLAVGTAGGAARADTGTGTATPTTSATGAAPAAGTMSATNGTGEGLWFQLDMPGTHFTPGAELSMQVWSSSESAAAVDLDFTLTLPPGVTYVRDWFSSSSDRLCSVATGGRVVTCHVGSGHQIFRLIRVAVADDLPVGTPLAFTLRAVTDYPDDPEPENNTLTRTAAVTGHSDWSVRWEPHADPVEPGAPVRTYLVLTYRGKDSEVMDFDVSGREADGGSIPPGAELVGPLPGGCVGTDPRDVIHCRTPGAVNAGSTVSFAFRWRFAPTDHGRTMTYVARLSAPTEDPDRSNDRSSLTLRVADGTVATTPPPTSAHPTTGPPATGSGTGGTTGGSSAGGTSGGTTGGTPGSTTSGGGGTSGGAGPSTAPADGSLARTGTSSALPLIVAAAGGALVLGSAAVLLVRRGRHR